MERNKTPKNKARWLTSGVAVLIAATLFFAAGSASLGAIGGETVTSQVNTSDGNSVKRAEWLTLADGSRNNPALFDEKDDTFDEFTGEPVSGPHVSNLDLVAVWFETAGANYEIHVQVKDLSSPGHFRAGKSTHAWSVLFGANGNTFRAVILRDIQGDTFGYLDVQGIQDSGIPSTYDGTAREKLVPGMDEVIIGLPKEWSVMVGAEKRTFAFTDLTVLSNVRARAFDGLMDKYGCIMCVPVDRASVAATGESTGPFADPVIVDKFFPIVGSVCIQFPELPTIC